ncbi:MAG: nif-specific transcriptional activator NifA [Methylophilales bacterium 39-45-7]|nr:MAG: nif-specific transcriptional activator NifA [Methylophilales bacterium 39-45-7]HQS36998.1 nif-specific transcriptional activator NifA [Methylotenera sp.]
MSLPSSKFDQIALITIYEVSKILSTSLSLDKTLVQALQVIASHLHMQRGMISLLEETKTLITIASIGLADDEMQRGVFKTGEGITGKIFKYGVPVVIPDIADEPLFLNKTGAYKVIEPKKIAFLGVPIKSDTKCIGVLSFQFERTESFSGFQPKLRLITMVARLIAQSVRLSQNISSERAQLLLEKVHLQNELEKKYSLNNVIGQSKLMQQVFSEVHMAAAGSSTVLLRGESGTGKEVIARALHLLSPRKHQPFIKVNCAALTESLLESELFGHEKGAFTGALHHRKGRFEQASGGTLFLDEIGDISPAFQVKLLRVLQEREFERVGGNATIKVDIRLICATNRNLEDDVRQGKFRADLYFRINVISINLPPLRKRPEDIPLLIQKVLDKFNADNKVNIKITTQALQVLMNCQWPGNVRELENCVARFCTLSHNHLIQLNDLPCQSNNCLSASIWQQQPQHFVIPVFKADVIDDAGLDTTQEHMRATLIQAMEKTGWVQAKAARLLNLTPRQIAYALKKHHVPLKKL